MRLIALTIILSLSLTACIPVTGPASQPTASIPTATNPAPMPEALTPTAAPTMTEPPVMATDTPAVTPTLVQPTLPSTGDPASPFQFVASNPVLAGPHDWDRVYIDPGAIIYQNGIFHMFYNGIDGFPRPVGVGYATSKDGLHWDPQVDQPLFHASDLFPNDPKIQNLFVTSGLVQPDGTWVLYFYTLEGSDFIHAQSIGRATAPDPKGPWKVDPKLVLTPGPAGAWDSLQVSGPDVIRSADGYVMYYDGMSDTTPSMIGRATSPDGITWTKYNDPSTTEAAFAESDPVLKPDASGWDSKRVLDANVLPSADGWKMIYLSTGCFKKFGSNCLYALGQATSSDGIHWQKAPNNPILSSQDNPDWRATYLVTWVQQGDADLLLMDYSGKTSGGTRIYLSTKK